MPKYIVRGQRVTEAKITVSKAMRREMTPAEATLWSHVRDRQVGGAKFRRQQIIAGFVADFYCHEYALVLEADGSTHEAQHDAVFAGKGITTLRFSNTDIQHDMTTVLNRICRFYRNAPIPD